jgi:hypothetical protein
VGHTTIEREEAHWQVAMRDCTDWEETGYYSFPQLYDSTITVVNDDHWPASPKPRLLVCITKRQPVHEHFKTQSIQTHTTTGESSCKEITPAHATTWTATA